MTRPLDTLLTALAPAIWGSTFLVTTEYLPDGYPVTVSLLRALPAGLLLLLLVRRLPGREWLGRIFILGGLNYTLFWIALFIGAYRLPGGVAATIGSLQPLMVIFLARLLLGRAISLLAVLAALAGLGGVALLLLGPGARLDPLGVVAALISAAAMASGGVLSRKWQPPVNMLTFTAWQLTAGGTAADPGGAAAGAALANAHARKLARTSLPRPDRRGAHLFFVAARHLPYGAFGGLGPRPDEPGDRHPARLGGAGPVPDRATAGGRPDHSHQRLAEPAPDPSTLTPKRRKLMKITIFGAGGDVGSRLVKETLFRGHEVTAVLRTPASIGKIPEGVHLRVTDVADTEQVARIVHGQDLVISAVRPPDGREQDMVGLTSSILRACGMAGVRVLIVGGAASLRLAEDELHTVLTAPGFLPDSVRPIALASQAQYELCLAETEADWTYLCPPAMLVPGHRVGRYRIGADILLKNDEGNSEISMEDFAVALLDEAEQPRHQGRRFTVAY